MSLSETRLLEVRALTKRFGGVTALDDVSFSVARGSIVGIMGANGAGKTTLFSLIAGNERPTSGEILWNGAAITGLRPERIARRGIARTFQIVRPFAGLTVLENALTAAVFGARKHRDTAGAEQAARAALALVGLDNRADDLAGTLTLSGQKRLEIARAVATGAELLLLDEVMAGLTASEVDGMLATLADLRRSRGMTLVVIEHVMRALMRLSDEIVVLHLGQRIAQGAPADIAANPDVQRAYLGA